MDRLLGAVKEHIGDRIHQHAVASTDKSGDSLMTDTYGRCLRTRKKHGNRT